MNTISDEDFIKKFRAFMSEIIPAPERNPTGNPIIGALYEIIDMVNAQEKTGTNGQFHNVTPQPPATVPMATAPQPTIEQPSTIAIIEPGETPTPEPVNTGAASTEGQKVVTIGGQRPAVPKSFFHTKKFLAIGVVIAVVMGALGYLIYSGRL